MRTFPGTTLKLKGGNGILANMLTWAVFGAIAFAIFGTIVRLTIGYDLFDFNAGLNRIVYGTIFTLSMLWLANRMTVDGIYDLGNQYGKGLSENQKQLAQKLDARWEREQELRAAARGRSGPTADQALTE